MTFSYGQKVRCISVPDGNSEVVNLIGTIMSTQDYGVDEYWPGVLFEKSFELGHCLTDETTGEIVGEYNGWYCPPETLIPLEESINIEEII